MLRELITPEGLRIDGRRAKELRNIKCKMGVFSKADGSSYYEQGNTKILCSVHGPKDVSIKSHTQHDRAIINCEYSMTTFSTGERKKKHKIDRRATEISLIIKETFESTIITSLYPNTQIDIHILVIQADGGTRCAAINATTLALIDAGIPMKDFVVSCAAGYYEDTAILDLNYAEDSFGIPDVPIAIYPRSNKIITIQMDSRLPIERFDEVLQCAMEGCQKIHTILEEMVKNRTHELLSSRGIYNV